MSIDASNLLCEERERLTQAYLDATEVHRKVCYCIEELRGPEWREVAKEARKACNSALTALKLHIRQHGC